MDVSDDIHEVKWTQSPRLSQASMHELADRVAAQRDVDPGIAYHRSEHVHKGEARKRVRGLFSRAEWPRGLSILTLPGLDWKFEQSLLESREGARFRIERGFPRRTFITAIERNEAIYRAATRKMPGWRRSMPRRTRRARDEELGWGKERTGSFIIGAYLVGEGRGDEDEGSEEESEGPEDAR